MNSGVYLITCSKDPRFYVGESIRLDRRLKTHLGNLRSGNHANYALQKAWDLYGEQSFTFRIAIRVPAEMTKEMEQAWIREYFAKGMLFNVVDAQRPSFSPETASRLSLAMRGRKKSPEHCANISKSQKGRLRSLEARKNMSLSARKRSPLHLQRLADARKASIGTKRSPEARRRMAAAWVKRKSKNLVA